MCENASGLFGVISNFKEKYFHPSKTIEEGQWGRRLQTFFNRFYGEAIELNPGEKYSLKKTDMPCAMVVWLGSGIITGIDVDYQNNMHGRWLCFIS